MRSSARPRLFAAVPADGLADLPGIPPRRARTGLRRMGQSDLQHPRLARPLLPDRRRPLRELPGTAEPDRLGAAGPRRRPALRHCLVHCGFEPAAVLRPNKGFRDLLRMAAWQMG